MITFIIVIVAIVAIFGTVAICSYDKFGVSLPFIEERIDISGKRKVDYDKILNDFLVQEERRIGLHPAEDYNYRIEQWKRSCENYIDSCLMFQEHKREIYNDMKVRVESEGYPFFQFAFYRNTTKYKQVNYVRHPYTEAVEYYRKRYSLKEMEEVSNKIKL